MLGFLSWVSYTTTVKLMNSQFNSKRTSPDVHTDSKRHLQTDFAACPYYHSSESRNMQPPSFAESPKDRICGCNTLQSSCTPHKQCCTPVRRLVREPCPPSNCSSSFFMWLSPIPYKTKPVYCPTITSPLSPSVWFLWVFNHFELRDALLFTAKQVSHWLNALPAEHALRPVSNTPWCYAFNRWQQQFGKMLKANTLNLIHCLWNSAFTEVWKLWGA